MNSNKKTNKKRQLRCVLFIILRWFVFEGLMNIILVQSLLFFTHNDRRYFQGSINGIIRLKHVAKGFYVAEGVSVTG